jgi:hypothetical protein
MRWCENRGGGWSSGIAGHAGGTEFELQVRGQKKRPGTRAGGVCRADLVARAAEGFHVRAAWLRNPFSNQ